MKAQYLMLLVAFLFTSVFSFAQTKTDTIKVYGNCGMCKDRIETAAKDAGATSADWNEETELLVVNYDATATNNKKIQEKIASVGHDTQDVKAPDSVYNKLEKCCQYKRKTDNKPVDSESGLNKHTSSSTQISNATLTASGLTCSMCSKAIYKAITKVDFVDNVQANIKESNYTITFKPNADINFDALRKAVEDAGFSVAKLTVQMNFDNLSVKNDVMVKAGGENLHFLNVDAQTLNGKKTLTIVDSKFTSDKEHKHFSQYTNMKCYSTGVLESCCSKVGNAGERIYHVTI
ncbi:MAG: heavy-metal-associated domain-containing protein [Ilyomonas sp.]